MRKIYLLCCTVIITSISFHDVVAQKRETNPNKYFMQQSLKQTGVGYLKTIKKIGVGMKLGYQFPYLHKKHTNPQRSLSAFKFLSFQGFTSDLLFNFYTNQKGNMHILSMNYNNITSGTLIDDPGRQAGTNSSLYHEFTEEFNAVGISYNYYVKKSDQIYMTFQIGIERRDITRKYSVEGTYGDQRPSSKIEHTLLRPLVLDFGLIFIFNK